MISRPLAAKSRASNIVIAASGSSDQRNFGA
jgi:hypothetical protein